MLTRPDDDRDRRQFGVVAANSDSATFTGSKAQAWAGGRRGPGYAVQGNILAGEDVVIAMEKAFVESKGRRLAERLYLALVAGEAKGGDSRGKQSASLLVAREKAGFLGFSDRAVDVRVDDHEEPFVELGRLMGLALIIDNWNQALKAFSDKRFAAALPPMECAAATAEKYPSMLADNALQSRVHTRRRWRSRGRAQGARPRARARSEAQAAGRDRPGSREVAVAQRFRMSRRGP